MTNCLASTGSGPNFPIMIFAAMLVLVGVGALVLAKRRSALAAMVLVPLLIVGGLLGSGAPTAQAAGPVMAQTLNPAGLAPGWKYRNDDGFDGYYVAWDPADKAAVQALIDVSAPALPTATVTGTISGDGAPVPFTFTSPITQLGPDLLVRVATDLTPFTYVSATQIANAVGTDGYTLLSLSVVISVPQADGCGGTVTSTITFDPKVAPPDNAG